jgi:hypothetical protein
MRVDDRARAKPSPRPPSEARPLASRFARSALRPWGLEPTVHRRAWSIEPRTSPSGSDPARLRHRVSACTPVASLAHRLFRRTSPKSRLGRSTVERDVLPAPPSGGAPRLPRPSSALHREGGHGLDLGDARSRSAGRPTSREVGHLFWGLAPRRVLSCARTMRRRSAYPPFELSPYEQFTSGWTLRRRNALGPS